MKIYPFSNFIYGLNTKPPSNKIPDGAASDSLNWLTLKGKLELNRGYAIMGTELTGSSSPVTGLKVGIMYNGNNVAYMTYNRKVRYYNDVVGDWTEVGTDLLPLTASGEDVTMDVLESVAGKQLWLNSPNTGPYKFNLANPGDSISMYDSSKNYKGWMRFIDNRAYLWCIDNFDKTSVRLSFIEVRSRSDFTGSGSGNGLVTSEVITNGGVVAAKGANAKVSIFDVSVTAGTETFTDDSNGLLVGSAGGSGTVNYQTGVISVSSGVGWGGGLTVGYRYVDETATWTSGGNATLGGVANFVVSFDMTTHARLASTPNIFVQGHGGDLKDIVVLNNHHFCLHERATYDIVQSQDDLTSTNTIFRESLGIKKLRGAYSTAEGIYSIDTTDPADPRFVLVNYSNRTPDIKPTILSFGLDLSNYVFDKAVVFPFNDYVIFACRTSDSPVNNRSFVYHRIFRSWDILDYCISSMDIYNNGLVAGDSLSPNVQKLFSGFDANGDTVNNYWVSGISRLGFLTPRGRPVILYGQKKVKKVYLEGYIAADQKLAMFMSIDRGQFIEIGSTDMAAVHHPIIEGSGSYVDKTQSITIGSDMIGDHPLGGNPSTPAIQAYHFARYVSLDLDRFEECQIKFVAQGIGYLSITRMEFRDIRVLQNKPSKKYRTT